MADRNTGIQVWEQAGAEQAIEPAPAAVTAFVGRTLRGPLNRPIALASFADFARNFGGLWQPSTLSYAVEQYFENGGQRALVVRVANGARPCTLSVPGPQGPLVLAALAPGTREYLRAAVDYDGIGVNEEDRFNLVIQRIRIPGSELVEDQEIYRRVSVDPLASRDVASALADSALVRLAGEVPPARPSPTLRADGRSPAGYVDSNPDGDDGAPLTDYDVIGSAAEGTGLFALRRVESFNFLCIPPVTRETDIGPGVLLVANRYCRDRRAVLVVDPPLAWQSADEAIAGMRDWPLASDNAVMYFPRLSTQDKLRGRVESFAPGGAVAGMLSRAVDGATGWQALANDDHVLRPGLRPATPVSDLQRQRLAALGINTLQVVRAPGREPIPAQTLAGPATAVPDWRFLAQRRLANFIVSGIEHGTRWLLFAPNEASTWRRAVEQLQVFFGSLEAQGAFDARAEGERWFVTCDERLNRELERSTGVVNLVFGFAAARPGDFHAFLLSHRPAGSRLHPVSMSRLQSSGYRPELLFDELPTAP
ncbi:MAG: hypothetical protein IT483_09715 [Gammaproteobacteria bacterium]|nr:hypothetical protein [Gammaproteobacteria bacterium]